MSLREGLFAEAEEALGRLLERDMDFPGAASMLKSASFWRERMEGARASAEEARPGHGGFEEGERLLALWRLFQAFAERLGDVPERAQFSLKQHVFSAALAAYQRSSPGAEDGGGDPDVLLQLGRCYRGLGSYERAIDCLERASRERRDDARTLAELADCYSLVNEGRRAKVFFREAFFLDPQAVDLEGLESPLIQRLAARVRARGWTGHEAKEWIPVLGTVWGVFNVKREMKPLEFGKLRQSIYQLERDLRAPSPARAVLVPRLVNRYMWLIDHYIGSGEAREKVDDVLARMRDVDPRVHAEYTA